MEAAIETAPFGTVKSPRTVDHTQRTHAAIETAPFGTVKVGRPAHGGGAGSPQLRPLLSER